ncbi:MAG: IS66 family transposase [Desulfobulbaceae bacterium]|uniref:IS66 family transposase n=1 Tax=Candidatus Desulfobia pelagia TaxID=2841692 RepID=A0A8J6NFU5_9BACT|nr:IS66 family transposase [Candidatus Desulfobia pelagia]
MNFDVSTLPNDTESLKRIIIEQQGHFDKETGILLEQIRHLRDKLFGRKSEKITADSGVRPVPLFDMPEPEDNELSDAKEEKIDISGHTRKKSGRKPLPEDLPRVDVVHDLPEEKKVCGCGCHLSRIGEEISEQLDIIPARIQVIRNIRPKYACRQCEGVEGSGPTVKIAPVSAQIIPKSMATAGLLAYVLTAKFVDALPFYRQEKQFARLGVEMNRATMCNWAMKAVEACQPLLNLLQEEVVAGPVVQADETTVQVLSEPGRDPTSKSYMWVFRRGDPKKSVLIYQYHPTRAGDVASAFLRDYKGYVQTDGYSGYDFLDRKQDIRHIGCWAHARRKFMDVIKAQGKNRKKTGSADVALKYIRDIYRIEKEAKGKELSVEEIYLVRQEQSKPILEQFKQWLSKRSLQTPPKGLLGKAISYTLKQWDRLVGYVEDGILSPDNNAAENSIRPFVVGRKNWLFAGTPEGAAASAGLYSLIETAKANDLEPYSYLRHIFKKLPKATTLQDIEALLPWRLDKKKLYLDSLTEVDN